MSNYKAKIVSVSKETLTKSNGGKTQLCQALITEGPLTGMTVLASRTLRNASGAEKSPVSAGQEVEVYHSQLPSTSNPGTMQNFFEVSTGLGASQDDINAKLNAAVSREVANALTAQAV